MGFRVTVRVRVRVRVRIGVRIRVIRVRVRVRVGVKRMCVCVCVCVCVPRRLARHTPSGVSTISLSVCPARDSLEPRAGEAAAVGRSTAFRRGAGRSVSGAD